MEANQLVTKQTLKAMDLQVTTKAEEAASVDAALEVVIEGPEDLDVDVDREVMAHRIAVAVLPILRMIP